MLVDVNKRIGAFKSIADGGYRLVWIEPSKSRKDIIQVGSVNKVWMPSVCDCRLRNGLVRRGDLMPSNEMGRAMDDVEVSATDLCGKVISNGTKRSPLDN